MTDADKKIEEMSGKAIIKSLSNYYPPRLKVISKVTKLASKIHLVKIVYMRTMLGVPHDAEFTEYVIVFGKLPAVPVDGTPLYFDLANIYLPDLANLRFVNFASIIEDLGNRNLVNFAQGGLIKFPSGPSDTTIRCCVNWRSSPSFSPQHPCLLPGFNAEFLSGITGGAEVDEKVSGGGKAICTFAMSYEDELLDNGGVQTLPLIFYMEKAGVDKVESDLNGFFNSTKPDQVEMVKANDLGLFMLPMILPGHSSIMFYCFPNRENSEFCWKINSNARGQFKPDKSLHASTRLIEHKEAHKNNGRTGGRILLGVNETRIMALEEWSNIISIQGILPS